jgi:hypothetical protein
VQLLTAWLNSWSAQSSRPLSSVRSRSWSMHLRRWPRSTAAECVPRQVITPDDCYDVYDSMVRRCAGMPKDAKKRCQRAAADQLADCKKKVDEGFMGAAGDSETGANMKRDLEFDEPIAERVIEGSDCTITVQIGPPRPETTDDDASWYCPYRIKGFPNEPDRERYAGGMDAVEALVYAIANIGAELNYREKKQLGLNWLDTEHLGFLDAHKLPWSTKSS